MKTFPKVLIIGQSFNDTSGAGITLNNLFHEWPKTHLANAIRLSEFDKSFNRCEKYYFLGDKEISIIKPLGFFLSVPKSATQSTFRKVKNKNNNKSIFKRIYIHKKIIQSIIKYILKYSGLYYVRYRYKLSNEFISWIHEFKPDVIYSALGSMDISLFVFALSQKVNYPIVIHIWDDWPKTLYENCLFKKYWQKKLNVLFNKLLNNTSKCFSISQAMSEEYFDRYNKNFLAFHNPIEINKWISSNSHKNQNEFIILYTGKINKDTIESLHLMGKTLETLNMKFNKTIKFHIYSPQKNIYDRQFQKYLFVKLFDAVPSDEIISVICNADLLYLPLDFKKSSIKYTQLSMPTKASEYMISGVPIIVLAHPKIALNKYAKEEEWGYVVESFNINSLRSALLEIANNAELREQLSQKAKDIAKKNHSAVNVRENFRKALLI